MSIICFLEAGVRWSLVKEASLQVLGDVTGKSYWSASRCNLCLPDKGYCCCDNEAEKITCLQLKFTVWNALFVLLSCGGNKPKQSNGDDTSGGETGTDMVFGTHSHCDRFIYLIEITIFLIRTKADVSHDPVDTVLLSLLRYISGLSQERKMPQVKWKIPGKSQTRIPEETLYVL